jgi:cytosine/adenosine deaminase-related metal-dependent hydrolase
MSDTTFNHCRIGAADVVLRNARRVEWNGICADPLPIANGRIAAETADTAWRRDLSGHLIFPGLVNAHDHLQMNCIPPLPRREAFPNSYAWIDAIQPHRTSAAVLAARAIPPDVRHWHGALKNLLSGVTTVGHHDPPHPILAEPTFPVRTLEPLCWSHSLGLGLSGPGASARFGPDVVASFASTPANLPWIIHLAEGTDEIANAELEELDQLGCLAANTVLVHGVGLTATT